MIYDSKRSDWLVRSVERSLLAGLLLCAVWFGYKLGIKLAPATVTVVMDMPKSIPQDRPKDILEALNNGCEVYPADYKLGLCYLVQENGRRGLEFGIQGISALIRERHREFLQAYMWARLTSDRQRSFCNDVKLQRVWANYVPVLTPKRFAKSISPFIIYSCYRYAPASGWKKYYWDEKTGSGIGYLYMHYSVGQLEEIAKKKRRERNAVKK